MFPIFATHNSPLRFRERNATHGLNERFMFLDRSAPNKNAIKVLDFVISFIVVDQPSFIPIPTWANLSGANVIMKFQALLLNMVF